MAHLGADDVRRQFKGMVERCADCGFDLAGGDVEVIPTAHYMMGGIECDPGCGTGLARLLVVGEDTGGVHGANRLGGNGVANSTVFGGIAGDVIASSVIRERAWEEPDREMLEAEVAASRRPQEAPAGDLDALRGRLYDIMWDDVGIIRDEAGLARAGAALAALDEELDVTGVSGDTLAYNLTWHDWLNLKNLVLVSRAITTSANARRESRGAHFREDHPEQPDRGRLEESRAVRVTLTEGEFRIDHQSVSFSRVRPGETLLS